MKYLNKSNVIASTVMFVLLFTSLAASAHDSSTAKSSVRVNRIVGLWDVQVAVASCAGGPAFATFSAMHQYQTGGTGQIVPAGNPTGLSAHMMVWTPLDGNNYLARFKMYRYDPAGNTLGWNIVTNEVSLSKDGKQYSGTGIAEFFDNDGNLLMASCPSFTGTRFSVEP
jgi:hypothetical protein